MATKRMINPNELMSEIDKVYYEHYAMAYDQAIRDFYNAVCRRIRRCTSVDAVEVVRCKDCKHWYDPEGVCLKIYSDGAVSPYAWQDREPDDFCSYGERRTNDSRT